jgi:hypothetical protein
MSWLSGESSSSMSKIEYEESDYEGANTGSIGIMFNSVTLRLRAGERADA